MKRLILFGLLGGLLATNTGCGLLQAVFCYRPCLSRGDCGPLGYDGCGPAYGPMQRPGYRTARVYAEGDGCCDTSCGRPCRRPNCVSCTPCVDPCIDPCGPGYYGRPWHRGPLSCVFALFSPCNWWGPHCGERYWGDFYSDPPDCWDPCDGCGNYTGSGYSSYGGANGGYEGYRQRSATGNVFSDAETVPAGEIVERRVGPAPKPAGQPHKATRP